MSVMSVKQFVLCTAKDDIVILQLVVMQSICRLGEFPATQAYILQETKSRDAGKTVQYKNWGPV